MEFYFPFSIGKKVQFIRSQKKNPQLAYDGYIYNKKLKQANGHTTWRCSELLKYKCKATCFTKENNLIRARNNHNHQDHWRKIHNKTLYDNEEDLEEYIEITSSNPKAGELLNVIDTGTKFKFVIADVN